MLMQYSEDVHFELIGHSQIVHSSSTYNIDMISALLLQYLEDVHFEKTRYPQVVHSSSKNNIYISHILGAETKPAAKQLTTTSTSFIVAANNPFDLTPSVMNVKVKICQSSSPLHNCWSAGVTARHSSYLLSPKITCCGAYASMLTKFQEV